MKKIIILILAIVALNYVVDVRQERAIENLKNLSNESDDSVCGLRDVVCAGETKTADAKINTQKTTKASWYHYEINGQRWSENHRTAASREFPRGTMVEVTNKANGKTVQVLINDFGPDAKVHPDRELDLSWYAFSQIADPRVGLIEVEYHAIEGDGNYKPEFAWTGKK